MSDSEFLASPYHNTLNWLKNQNLDYWHQPETTSTNTVAKDDKKSIQTVKFYITNHQTQGRGRNTNTWTDNHGVQLLLTISIPIKNVPPVWATLCVGEVLTSSLKKVWGSHFLLKAPNDIYLNGKKLCGILTEVSSQIENGKTSLRLIIGIGLNVLGHPYQYPSSSLLEVSPLKKIKSLDWNQFLNHINLRFESLALSSFASESQAELEPKLINCGLHHLDHGKFLGFAQSHGLKFQEKVISWTDL